MAPLRVDASLQTAPDRYVVVISGDLDSTGAAHVMRLVSEAGLVAGLATTVRLDGVGLFGSAATRVVEGLLAAADDTGTALSIDGIPSHAQRVLDIVGIEDERLTQRPTGAASPLSPAVFDAVMAAGMMRTREAVCITSADVDDPRIVFVNEAFTELTGFVADDVLGRNPRLLQGPLTDRTVLDRLKKTLRNGTEFNGEAVNYRSDGTPFWMNWRILPISYGLQNFFIALQRDGTELRQLTRFDSARNRMLVRVSSATADASEIVLEALGEAVALVVEAPDARVSVVVTDAGGRVVGSNLEGRWLDADVVSNRGTQTFETDGSASLQIPFPVGTEHVGHLHIEGLHADWVHLTDKRHLLQLCADVAPAISITPMA